MHGGDDKPIRRCFTQHVGNKGKLSLAKASLVPAIAKIVDVVQHQKQCATVFKGIISRAKNSLECLAGIFPIAGLEIQVMIAGNIMPRYADPPDDAIIPGVERQVVGHEIAQRHAECGFGPHQCVHHIGADVVDCGWAVRMRISEQNDVETGRLAGFFQREVYRARQLTGRFDAAFAQPQMSRRPPWLMNVIETGQHDARIDRHAISGRLDHKNDRFVIHRQCVSAVAIGPHHIVPVRYQHASDSRIASLAHAGA